jgi:hypothetical protein
MEKKQTAVEWLFEKTNDLLIDFTEGNISAALYRIRATEYKYKAKEMEKEQIMEAVSFGDCRGRVTTYLTDEEYYNEIYGK